MSKFVHLHLHSNYSILDGAINLNNLALKLKENEMNSCAITDHGSMFGVYKFYKNLKAENIKPIIGCEIYTTAGSRFKKVRDNYHLIMLCMDKRGYNNLSKLLSLAYTEGFYYNPRADKEILKKYSDGLMVTSACIGGEIPSLILEGKYEQAKEAASWFKDTYKDRFYIEIQDNKIHEQDKVNPKLISLAKELDIPLIGSCDAHFINREDAFVQDVLLCISTKQHINDPKRKFKIDSEDLYVKNDIEINTGIFKEHPESISNTVKVAELCNFSFDTGTYYLPIMGKTESDSNDIIKTLSWQGLEKKTFPLELLKVYQDRINFELDIITKMGYASYYLIVQDFIKWARDHDIPVGPGRGSGAASLVAYVLGITNLDPIKYDLIFERFLNPERVSLPDFDIDFCSRRRDEVIEYVTKKYGEAYTSRINTFGFLKARSAVKDVGRVLEYSYQEVDELSKMIPFGANSITEAINTVSELKETIETNERYKKLIEVALKLEGSVRNVGIHAGGVIISSIPIDDVVPVYLSKDGFISTQFDMKDVEALGLVKFDFLAIEILTIISDAEKHIRKYKNKDFDLETISLDDKAIYDELFSKGDTVGVFQLESTGMQKLLQKLKPDCFEDIIAINALYRPGPLGGGVVDSFVNRKHGRENIVYFFDELEPILKETYGIIVYQEQVQKIASVLAGYSLGEADLLRRAMGKKNPKEMAMQRKRFISGAVGNGHDEKKSEALFELMAKFAEYGFNKAHAAVYALIAYRTAFLKYYYNAEFFSALLTLKVAKQKIGDAVDPATHYISDAVSHKINILPPCINESVYTFEPKEKDIRFGFCGIKNIGVAVIDNIIEERSNAGVFKGFIDFCYRIDGRKVNKKALENLIKAGAFDCMGINRGILFNNIEKIIVLVNDLKKQKQLGQFNLFANIEDNKTYKDEDYIDYTQAEWNVFEAQNYEKEVLGFFISSHPLDNFLKIVNTTGTPSIESLLHSPPGVKVYSAIGILSFKKEIISKNGKKMGIYTLEDKNSSIDMLLGEDLYLQTLRNPRLLSQPVIIKGAINKNDKNSNFSNAINLENIKPLDDSCFELIINIDETSFEDKRKKEFFESLPKSIGLVKTFTNILFRNEGQVKLKIGSFNLIECIEMCDKINKNLNKEVFVKWAIVS